MSTVNNLLPGSKKPIPRLLETSKIDIKLTKSRLLDDTDNDEVIFFWKMVELNKVLDRGCAS